MTSSGDDGSSGGGGGGGKQQQQQQPQQQQQRLIRYSPNYITGLGDGNVKQSLNPPPRNDDDDTYDAYLRYGGSLGGRNTRRSANRKKGSDYYGRTTAGTLSSWSSALFSSSKSSHRSSSGGIGGMATEYYPVEAAAPWQLSAFALLGAVVLLSALFLHVLADTAAENAHRQQQQRSRQHRRTTSTTTTKTRVMKPRKEKVKGDDDDSNSDAYNNNMNNNNNNNMNNNNNLWPVVCGGGGFDDFSDGGGRRSDHSQTTATTGTTQPSQQTLLPQPPSLYYPYHQQEGSRLRRIPQGGGLGTTGLGTTGGTTGTTGGSSYNNQHRPYHLNPPTPTYTTTTTTPNFYVSPIPSSRTVTSPGRGGGPAAGTTTTTRTGTRSGSPRKSRTSGEKKQQHSSSTNTTTNTTTTLPPPAGAGAASTTPPPPAYKAPRRPMVPAMNLHYKSESVVSSFESFHDLDESNNSSHDESNTLLLPMAVDTTNNKNNNTKTTVTPGYSTTLIEQCESDISSMPLEEETELPALHLTPRTTTCTTTTTKKKKKNGSLEQDVSSSYHNGTDLEEETPRRQGNGRCTVLSTPTAMAEADEEMPFLPVLQKNKNNNNHQINKSPSSQQQQHNGSATRATTAAAAPPPPRNDVSPTTSLLPIPQEDVDLESGNSSVQWSIIHRGNTADFSMSTHSQEEERDRSPQHDDDGHGGGRRRGHGGKLDSSIHDEGPFQINDNDVSSNGSHHVVGNDPRFSIDHKRDNLMEGTNAAASLQGSIDFSEINLVEVIGGGGFGQVWKGVWHSTPVAVKVLTGSAQSQKVPRAVLEEFAAEINLIQGMRHPNICLYMGACLQPPNRAIITELAANGSLWDALRLPLVPPYRPVGIPPEGLRDHEAWSPILYQPDPRHGMPPSLLFNNNTTTNPNLLRKSSSYYNSTTTRTTTKRTTPPIPEGQWSWGLVKRVACGTARGMAYLHNGNPPVLHRDLKSANILLNESYTPKLCDFGLSRLQSSSNTSMTGNCGTVQWMAPEVLSNQRYNEKADIYSYGIILWELLTRSCPYEGMGAVQCALAVLNRNARPTIPPWCPPFLQVIIRACWKTDPQDRPTFEQILVALESMPPKE